ncbi:hypothetical protein GYMLUDRAFT_829172 [Collybiopsis luxurians FD-317 M1]|uniref:Uncharacterized protein n=1 Tax=Collybiopsis luxurians FD-317 M1 TaxID=944289 RepID=A0A0D0AZ26_9AGAR|nr:hypothetical protein GYMLUDRAFT_829172 [Collybiopsis luxurians FD-317 M1]
MIHHPAQCTLILTSVLSWIFAPVNVLPSFKSNMYPNDANQFYTREYQLHNQLFNSLVTVCIVYLSASWAWFMHLASITAI